MLGLAVNLIAVIAGSGIGVLAGKRITDEISGGVISAIGLCILMIGITGLFTGASSVVMLLAFGIGALIGTGADLDGKLERAGQRLETRMTRDDSRGGFMNACLTFFLVSCTGAYTITACFSAGMGDNTMLYSKAIMDIIVSMTMAAGMGIGVMLSIVPMFIYQGLLILFSSLLAPLMTKDMVAALSCSGSLITIVIALNMMGATRLKAVNYLPAIILAPLIQYLFTALGL